MKATSNPEISVVFIYEKSLIYDKTVPLQFSLQELNSVSTAVVTKCW